MSANLILDCDNCGAPGDEDTSRFDVIAIGRRFAIVWPCSFCGDGLRVLGPGKARAVMMSGARVDQSALDLASQMHGPLI